MHRSRCTPEISLLVCRRFPLKSTQDIHQPGRNSRDNLGLLPASSASFADFETAPCPGWRSWNCVQGVPSLPLETVSSVGASVFLSVKWKQVCCEHYLRGICVHPLWKELQSSSDVTVLLGTSPSYLSVPPVLLDSYVTPLAHLPPPVQLCSECLHPAELFIWVCFYVPDPWSQSLIDFLLTITSSALPSW